MIINFPLKTSIHCETGSVKNLLSYYGYEISEELIFGIGSGYHFIHVPFPMLTKNEASLYRIIPGKVLKNFSQRTKIDLKLKTFINKQKSMKELDALLEKNIPTGLVTEVYGLYFWRAIMPDWHRFPGHHIVIFGKEKDEYYISETDPLFADKKQFLIKANELKQARFTNNFLSPRGKMFYLKSIPEKVDLNKAIIKGIKGTCFNMIHIPISYFGVKGIYTFSKRILKYEKVYGRNLAIDNLRFQLLLSEEAGSGGSGFRYIYSAFLEQAANIMNDNQLRAFSKEMRIIADTWQTFAVETLRFTKIADNGFDPFPETTKWQMLRSKAVNQNTDMKYLSDLVKKIAQMEETFFKNLNEWVKGK